MRKWHKWLIGIVVLLVGLSGAWAVAVHQLTYQPSKTAEQANQAATHKAYGDYFPAAKAGKPMVIFYPGALVAPQSYSIWAKQVAACGYPVAIVKMPLNLAVLSGNAADKVATSRAGYVIGGHSLGGVMAARYAHNHPSAKLHGVYFMASYPDAKGSLKHTGVPVLSLTASNDGVLNWAAWRKAKAYLPADTQYKQLSGGNHAGFGSYGAQRGDKPATISDAKQQHWIAAQMINWLKHTTND